jgi:hypothetical protein
MKPFCHAKNSARKWGGKPEDYQAIHDFFDSSKAAMPDVRHRAILHSAFGIFVLEKVFGTTITNSDGRQVSVRDIGEDHVLEDLGFIPTVERWLKHMPIETWMGGGGRKNPSKFIPMAGEPEHNTD